MDNEIIYYDKHGRQLEPGMVIRHDSGATEVLQRTYTADGLDDLGVYATNPRFLALHPDWDIEFYSLMNCATVVDGLNILGEWEVIATNVDEYARPTCFTAEPDNPYPLCVGAGKPECENCCLRADLYAPTDLM